MKTIVKWGGINERADIRIAITNAPKEIKGNIYILQDDNAEWNQFYINWKNTK